MERRRTFKVNKNKNKKTKNKNKNKYKKKNKKTTNKSKNQKKNKQTSTQTKTKQNEYIQTSERRVHYTRSMKHCKKFFLDSKIQHLTQWEKFTPLSATKEQLSYQHWKSEKISYTFISSVDLDSYPFHNILLRIQADTSIDIPWV